MTAAPATAIGWALAVQRAPTRLAAFRDQDLPDGMLALIKIAAGDEESLNLACAASGQPATLVSEAAVFAIQQVLFAPEADSYRVLGADADWPVERIKEHYRWLVRWLHPDRNDDEWDAIYADRVNRAWNDVRTPERRRDYDRSRKLHAVPAGAAAMRRSGEIRITEGAPVPSGPRLSARTVQRLPTMIFGGLLLVAFGILGVLYVDRHGVALVNPFALAQVSGGDGSERAAAATTPDAADVDADAEAALAEGQPGDASSVGADAPASAADATEAVASATNDGPSPSGAEPAADDAADSTDIASTPTPPAIAPAQAAPVTPLAVVALPTAPRAQAPSPASAIRDRSPPSPAPVTIAAKPTPKPAVIAAATPPARPVAVATAPAAAPVAAPRFDEDAMLDLFRRFRGAYASGDMARMQALFARGDGAGASEREQVLQTYRQLFDDTVARRIELSNPSWLSQDGRAVIVASYDAWVMPRQRQLTQHLGGDLRLDLVQEAGELRIARLRNQPRAQ